MDMNLLALPCGIMIGFFFKGGEIINCLLMSLTLINSLKVILISFPSKFVV